MLILPQICMYAPTQPTMKALQVVTVLVTFLMLGHAVQTEYFVTPNEDTPCPALPCHTLSHYLENTTRYFTSNTRISFLHGVHEINKSGVFHVKDVSNLTLTGYNVSSSHTAIVCMQPASLSFENMKNLVVKHLSIIYCGYPILSINNGARAASAAVLLEDIISLKLLDISVENSTGYGVMGLNVLGNSSISHSRFMFNNYYTLDSTNCSYGLGTCQGGNMYLYYGETVTTSPNHQKTVAMVAGQTYAINFDSCLFSNGVDVSEGLRSKISAGLSMYFSNGLSYHVDVLICNTVSTRNIAKRGANFLFKILSNIGSITINNSTSSMAKYAQQLDVAGFEFHYDERGPSGKISTANKTILHISESKFHDNIGGGVNIQLYKKHSNVKYQVIIKNCSFQRNVGPVASGIKIGQPVTGTLGFVVLVKDTNFTDEMTSQSIPITNRFSFNAMAVSKLKSLIIINCTFTRNKQTALKAFESTLYFGGHIIFSENSGTFGGAMTLQGSSTFYLMPHTHIEITNNHARRGGGIYVEDEATVTTFHPCFFQLVDLQYPNLSITAVITLENNTADEAGSALYGGEVDHCYLYTSNRDLVYNNTAFTSIFKILKHSSPVSQVSSNPIGIYPCNQHRIIQPEILYPGQMFKIPVVLRGQRNGSVPGTVHSELVVYSRGTLLSKPRGAHLAPLQETQKIQYSCTNLTYTVFSTAHYELIMIRIDDVRHSKEKVRTLIHVLLSLCPPGFQLSNLTAQCECAPLLKDRGLLCNISGATPLVQRTKSVWISTHPNGNDTILHDNCPLDYCKLTPLWLQLDQPDEQCAYGHSGLLCGRCKSNLSLAIGTSQCLECTTTHFALLFPFALAGLMLVMFLIVCNLTVSTGTINGLIFYANIVRVNHAFFFMTPTTSALKAFQQVLAVFIAWLNLDLGIETCFVHGMDAYIRTWLQFAFPFYIWTIVGVIIYLSRRSITVVKLVGSSAVSVLATLFLLSYAKLQRTVITAFSFTYLQNYYGDGRSLAVWLYDGNVPFLQEKHIALFLMALAVTVFFLLPFTLLLLFAPCLQASNHFLIKRVKMKLLPLLDAYQAPYKDKFRFWTGLMLVVRSILLVGFGLNILGDPDINNLLTVTVLAILLCCTWIIGIVYKNTALNILEASFILNLLTLSSWTVYSRYASNGDSSDGQTALVCTSTGVAFATFICILFYHTYLYLRSSKLHQRFQTHKVKQGNRREIGTVEGSVESAHDPPPHSPPTRSVIELREPLLTDS